MLWRFLQTLKCLWRHAPAKYQTVGPPGHTPCWYCPRCYRTIDGWTTAKRKGGGR